jgi:hypothetical protein
MLGTCGSFPAASPQRSLDYGKCFRDASAAAFVGTTDHKTDTCRASGPCGSACVTRDVALRSRHKRKAHIDNTFRLRESSRGACKSIDQEIHCHSACI